jgi:hypothetical protein
MNMEHWWHDTEREKQYCLVRKLRRRHIVNTDSKLSASAYTAFPMCIKSENIKTSKTHRAWNSNVRYRNRLIGDRQLKLTALSLSVH